MNRIFINRYMIGTQAMPGHFSDSLTFDQTQSYFSHCYFNVWFYQKFKQLPWFCTHKCHNAMDMYVREAFELHTFGATAILDIALDIFIVKLAIWAIYLYRCKITIRCWVLTRECKYAIESNKISSCNCNWPKA